MKRSLRLWFMTIRTEQELRPAKEQGFVRVEGKLFNNVAARFNALTRSAHI